MKRLRLSAFLALAAVCALALATQATAVGTRLRDQVTLVGAALSEAGATAPYTNIRIDAVRDTPASVLIHDAAMLFGGEYDAHPLAGSFLSNHHPRAVQAIAMGPGRECRVVASAQAFDNPTTSIGLLPTYVQPQATAWRYALFHEAAHCSWNPALRMSQYLNTHQKEIGNLAVQALLFDLAQQVGEGYADSYAVFMLRRTDRSNVPDLVRRITAWRQSTSSDRAIHYTSASLACALNTGVEALRTEAPYSALHAAALRCALLGARDWLEANRVDHRHRERYLALLAKLAELPRERT